MTRSLIGLLTAMLFPMVAYAQEAKAVQLADYVTFCLALFANSSEIEAKASALGLQGVSGMAGARITIGKSTIQFYKSDRGNQTVGAFTTIFADGKDSYCDVNPATAMERTDLQSMERSLDLDGQILTLGAATIGRWKMPNRQPPVLLKALISKSVVTLTVQEFEATAKDLTQRH